MGSPILETHSLEELAALYEDYITSGMSQREYCKDKGVSRSGLRRRLRAYEEHLGKRLRKVGVPEKDEFEIETELHDEVADLDEIKDKRKREFSRKHKAKDARKLISCKVNIDGPIGILHMGDNHVDDPGTDLAMLERHVELIQDTEGLFGANVGDMANHWVGRLARLHAHQTTTEAETWRLVEWIVTSVD